ncbi:hypothetical protein D4R89_05590 [bacterium]|nr:MAG: hypothetical protein D4R89_05590 [bacterium]
MALEENDPGLEIIAVKIGREVRGSYSGLGGTFASFVYCCLDKKIVPGFHEKGLIDKAELKKGGLLLVLSGKRTETELMEVMDIALENIGAFTSLGAEAKYIIDVKSKE